MSSTNQTALDDAPTSHKQESDFNMESESPNHNLATPNPNSGNQSHLSDSKVNDSVQISHGNNDEDLISSSKSQGSSGLVRQPKTQISDESPNDANEHKNSSPKDQISSNTDKQMDHSSPKLPNQRQEDKTSDLELDGVQPSPREVKQVDLCSDSRSSSRSSSVSSMGGQEAISQSPKNRSSSVASSGPHTAGIAPISPHSTKSHSSSDQLASHERSRSSSQASMFANLPTSPHRLQSDQNLFAQFNPPPTSPRKHINDDLPPVSPRRLQSEQNLIAYFNPPPTSPRKNSVFYRNPENSNQLTLVLKDGDSDQIATIDHSSSDKLSSSTSSLSTSNQSNPPSISLPTSPRKNPILSSTHLKERSGTMGGRSKSESEGKPALVTSAPAELLTSLRLPQQMQDHGSDVSSSTPQDTPKEDQQHETFKVVPSTCIASPIPISPKKIQVIDNTIYFPSNPETSIKEDSKSANESRNLDANTAASSQLLQPHQIKHIVHNNNNQHQIHQNQPRRMRVSVISTDSSSLHWKPSSDQRRIRFFVFTLTGKSISMQMDPKWKIVPHLCAAATQRFYDSSVFKLVNTAPQILSHAFFLNNQAEIVDLEQIRNNDCIILTTEAKRLNNPNSAVSASGMLSARGKAATSMAIPMLSHSTSGSNLNASAALAAIAQNSSNGATSTPSSGISGTTARSTAATISSSSSSSYLNPAFPSTLLVPAVEASFYSSTKYATQQNEDVFDTYVLQALKQRENDLNDDIRSRHCLEIFEHIESYSESAISNLTVGGVGSRNAAANLRKSSNDSPPSSKFSSNSGNTGGAENGSTVLRGRLPTPMRTPRGGILIPADATINNSQEKSLDSLSFYTPGEKGNSNNFKFSNSTITSSPSLDSNHPTSNTSNQSHLSSPEFEVLPTLNHILKRNIQLSNHQPKPGISGHHSHHRTDSNIINNSSTTGSRTRSSTLHPKHAYEWERSENEILSMSSSYGKTDKWDEKDKLKKERARTLTVEEEKHARQIEKKNNNMKTRMMKFPESLTKTFGTSIGSNNNSSIIGNNPSSVAATAPRQRTTSDLQRMTISQVFEQQHSSSSDQITMESNGKVIGMSVERVIQRITTDSTLNDSSFAGSFLYVYKLYMTTEELLDMLFARWQQHQLGDSTGIKKRIVSLIHQWIQILPYDFVEVSSSQSDPNSNLQRRSKVLSSSLFNSKTFNHLIATAEKMAETGGNALGFSSSFVDEIKQNLAKSTGITHLDDILSSSSESSSSMSGDNTDLKLSKKASSSALSSNTTNPTIPTSLSSSSSFPSPFSPPLGGDILDFQPMEVARQITLLEKAYFDMCLPSEFHKVAWTKKDKESLAPNILAMIRFSNFLVDWICTEILKYEDEVDRAMVINRFIYVAHYCMEMNNFDGAMVALSALRRSSIFRLKKSWNQLSDRAWNVFEQIELLFEPGSNYTNYRSVLENSKPPCIPYMGRILSDIFFLEEKEPNFISSSSSAGGVSSSSNDRHINIVKVESLGGVLKYVGELQKVPYVFKHFEVISSYIYSQEVLDEKRAYAISLEHERRQVDKDNLNQQQQSGANSSGATKFELSPSFVKLEDCIYRNDLYKLFYAYLSSRNGENLHFFKHVHEWDKTASQQSDADPKATRDKAASIWDTFISENSMYHLILAQDAFTTATMQEIEWKIKDESMPLVKGMFKPLLDCVVPPLRYHFKRFRKQLPMAH